MEQLKRTAPVAWGTWPPKQEVINRVVERAARAIIKRAQTDPRLAGEMFLAMPYPADSFANTFYNEQSNNVRVGHILALVRHRSWYVTWYPATDEGRVHYRGYDPKA